MLVMDEFTDKWSQSASTGGVSYENWDANWQNDAQVVCGAGSETTPLLSMWSMGNEVYYGATIPCVHYNRHGANSSPYVHALDKGSSRPVLHACNVQDAAGYVNLAKIQDNFRWPELRRRDLFEYSFSSTQTF
jgi:beta-galactosidase/beta-glucuronidase